MSGWLVVFVGAQLAVVVGALSWWGWRQIRQEREALARARLEALRERVSQGSSTSEAHGLSAVKFAALEVVVARLLSVLAELSSVAGDVLKRRRSTKALVPVLMRALATYSAASAVSVGLRRAATIAEVKAVVARLESSAPLPPEEPSSCPDPQSSPPTPTDPTRS